MENRPNIILYISYWDHIKSLNEKQKGQLLSALFCFQMGKEIPKMDPVTYMAFSFISADIKRNNDKYDDIIEKRREAGKKGGRPRKDDDEKKQKSKRLFEKAKKAIEKEKEIEIEKEKEKEKEIEKETVCSVDTLSRTREDDTTHTDTFSEPVRVPEMAAIHEENEEHGYGLTAESIQGFVEYNRSRGWKMDWRTALKKWAEKEHPPSTKRKPAGAFANFPQRTDKENADLVAKVISMGG